MNNNEEFAEEILEELINEGYSGKDLLKEFKSRQSKVRPAIKEMLNEAHKMAKGEMQGTSYDDVFGEGE